MAVLLSACGGSRAKTKTTTTTTTEKGADGTEQPITVSTTTSTAVSKEVASSIHATGSLVANETSDIAPQTSGQVISTPVSVGAFVKAGTVLARLDDKDARLRLAQSLAGLQQSNAAVRQAEARLGLGPNGRFDASAVPEVRSANAAYEAAAAQARLAEANARRYAQLVESGDVARSVYDEYRTQAETTTAQANNARQQLETAVNVARQNNAAIQTAQGGVASAQAQVEIAKKAVADTVIKAPYSGYVSNRPTAVGEYVTPASIIATLLLTNPIKLQLQVPEDQAANVKVGQGVSVSVDAYGDRKFGGHVSAINPAIDPVSRSITVEAEIENADNVLRSGMFASAELTRSGGSQIIYVPASAMLSDPNTNSNKVFVIQGDTAHLRVVQVGDTDNGMIQILSGVAANDVVATSNLQQLYEGAKVKLQ